VAALFVLTKKYRHDSIMLCDISRGIILKAGWKMSYTSSPMTEAMYYILLALMNPNHGYQLMAAIEQVSNGRIKMGPGTLYGVLTRLQKDEMIVILNDDGRRKTYAITEDGRTALNVEYKRLKDMIQDGVILEERS